jgi:hypothetical protein
LSLLKLLLSANIIVLADQSVIKSFDQYYQKEKKQAPFALRPEPCAPAAEFPKTSNESLSAFPVLNEVQTVYKAKARLKSFKLPITYIKLKIIRVLQCAGRQDSRSG